MIPREDVKKAVVDSWARRLQVDDVVDAILALIQSTSEVPVQRDERSEKLGEQLDAMVAECNANHRIIGRLEERVRELDAAWLRHTWPCGHISEGTGDEPDRCRICIAEERAQKAEGERDTWKDCIAEEMAENIKLFNLLGVMPEIEFGRAGTDAVVDAVQRLQADLATARAEIATDDTLLAERQRILDALPCPDHGPCVPHVLEWIEKARNAEALAANLKRVDNERAIELMRVRRDLATVGDAVGRLVKVAEARVQTGHDDTCDPGDPCGCGYSALRDALDDPAFAAWRKK